MKNQIPLRTQDVKNVKRKGENMNKEYIKSLSRDELERAYIDALGYIAKTGSYVEFILGEKQKEE